MKHWQWPKWPLVWRSTMIEDRRRQENARSQLVLRHESQLAALQRDIRDHVRPVCVKLMKVRVAYFSEGMAWQLTITLDEALTKAFNEFPDRAQNEVGQYVAFKLYEQASRPREPHARR